MKYNLTVVKSVKEIILMNRMMLNVVACGLFLFASPFAPAQEDMAFEEFTQEEAPEMEAADSEAVSDGDSAVEVIEPGQVTEEQRVRDAAALAEQERVRKEAARREAREALDRGLEAMQKGQWALAVDLFEQAQAKLPKVERVEEEIEIARRQKSEAYFQMALGIYENRRQGGNLDQAKAYLDQSLESWPENPKPELLRQDIRDYQQDVAKGKEDQPLEDEPKYADAQERIDQLLARGRKELEIGDYDQAEDTFEKVLRYDRYNRPALRFLEKVAQERWEVHQVERKVSTVNMMDQVEKRWLLPRKVDQSGEKTTFEPGDGGIEMEITALERKLDEIVIDEIRFQRANITDVISYLVQSSREQDPEGIGVNIIFMDPELGSGGTTGGGGGGAPAAAEPADPFGFGAPAGGGGTEEAPAQNPIPPITLELRNVTLLNALKTVTDIAGLYYRIERNMVIIEREGTGQFITRFYPVDPNRFTQIKSAFGAPRMGKGGDDAGPFGGDPFGGGGDDDAGGDELDLNQLFSRYGVKIPQEGDIAYEPLISQLVVTLTPDQFPKFEEVLRKINVAPRQVEIEARFVEVLQQDLEQLGFEWILNDNAEVLVRDGPGPVAARERIQVDSNTDTGFTEGLRFFDFDEVANATQRNARNEDGNNFLGDILSVRGVLTNPELQMVVQALDQEGNTDLLSAPRVTTINGVNAIIEVVEEIIYPTEFDITENDIEITGAASGQVFIPPTVIPGGFETRETGVILNVTPTVSADNYTINLVMLPEIAELVEWLQYGTQIPVGDRTYNVNIPQPVFASRNITTSMIVWDGHTVVMGGLIREDLVTFSDKIPILGDIPILGRLFRSEGRKSEKRNLLIFVTARLVDPAGNALNAGDRQDLVTGGQSGSRLQSTGGPVATGNR